MFDAIATSSFTVLAGSSISRAHISWNDRYPSAATRRGSFNRSSATPMS
jgi:hypothetical protein